MPIFKFQERVEIVRYYTIEADNYQQAYDRWNHDLARPRSERTRGVTVMEVTGEKGNVISGYGDDGDLKVIWFEPSRNRMVKAIYSPNDGSISLSGAISETYFPTDPGYAEYLAKFDELMRGEGKIEMVVG